MNRLIIIGNGFDIAHELETSYHDFLLNYLKECIINALNNLLENNRQPYNRYFCHEDELIVIKFNQSNSNLYYASLLSKVKNLSEFNEFIKQQRIEILYHFRILEKGIGKLVEYNWVDFEIEYFKELIGIKKNGSKVDFKIKELNAHFEIFKEKLETYLKDQKVQYKSTFESQALCDCFCEDILDIDVDLKSITSHSPNRLLFLNFNYTKTIEKYVLDCQKRIPSEINYIHGSVFDQYNPPIFGFGDEFDKTYKEFEDEGNNELFKHIKSFGYLKTNNYSNLTRFLETEPFQVQIFGHSCGLSDRTMFKEIVEHENCLSIKLFFHQKDDGSDDYTEKTYELYRHFSDKNSMRKKIVDKQKCRAMPRPVL